MQNLLSRTEYNFNRLETFWESGRARTLVGYLLVGCFTLSIIVIELQRRGWLPAELDHVVPSNHFYAVSLVFNLLLLIEIVGLVFALTHSVASAVGKQFEILSLILLRQSFKEFIHFSEPIIWLDLSTPVLHILSDAGGALLIFVLLGFYYRQLRHQAITRDERETRRFISAKKILSLMLLLIFTGNAIYTLFGLIMGFSTPDFFATFYTILIFADILIVLISLRYSYNYHSLFRNSGFALTTVLIRLALTAPPYVNVALGMSAGLFALGLTYAYNIFTQESSTGTS